MLNEVATEALVAAVVIGTIKGAVILLGALAFIWLVNEAANRGWF